MSIKHQLLVTSTLTLAEMKARYRNTVAGVLWVMLNPLIMFSVHALIFKYILRIDIDRYFIFLLSGLLPWIFISNTVTQSVHCFITMRESLLSFQIHPMAVISSKCADQFINFIIPFIFLFFLLADSESFNWVGLALIPFALISLFLGVFFLAMLLATLQVFFRDTEYITTFLFNILFFLTPIFYPRHLIPDDYQIFVDLNPIYAWIQPFKIALWKFNITLLSDALFTSFGVSILFGGISILFWRWTRNELYINI